MNVSYSLYFTTLCLAFNWQVTLLRVTQNFVSFPFSKHVNWWFHIWLTSNLKLTDTSQLRIHPENTTANNLQQLNFFDFLLKSSQQLNSFLWQDDICRDGLTMISFNHGGAIHTITYLNPFIQVTRTTTKSLIHYATIERAVCLLRTMENCLFPNLRPICINLDTEGCCKWAQLQPSIFH